jgi:membrane protein
VDITRLQAWASHQLFYADTRGRPWWTRMGLFLVRLAYAVIMDAARGQLTLRAMGLVYTTLLSLVPLLAVSFSMLKAFGVHNQMEPMLARLLAPLGPKGSEITTKVVAFVENIQVGVLGALGMILLLYTVIALMQKIEQAFNATWRVQRLRRLSQRFSDYLSVLLVGPVLVFSALGLTATVLSSEIVRSLAEIPGFGLLIATAAKLLPYALIIGAFTFVYIFVPNTRVRPLSALFGALVAGVLWQSTGWVFGSFIAGSTRYTAVYSAFATLILFMIWLYLSWLILLIGASVAYYHQHPRRLVVAGDETRLSPALMERVALSVMALVARAHYRRQPTLTLDDLANALGLPTDTIMEAVSALTQRRLLATLADEDNASAEGFMPAAPLEETRVAEVLHAARHHREGGGLDPESMSTPAVVARYMNDVEATIEQRFGRITIRELAVEGDASDAPPQQAESIRDSTEAANQRP